MVQKRIILDVWEKNNVFVKAVQGEVNSRFLEICLTDHGNNINLADKSVQVYLIKPDGKEIYNSVTILDAEIGTVLLELTSEMSNACGIYRDAEIRIVSDDGETLKIKGLNLSVEKSMGDSAIESSSEFTALQVALGDVTSMKSHMNSTLNPHDVTVDQIGAISASEKGTNGGVATLGDDGKLVQMPNSNDIGAIPITDKGTNNGVATLNANGKLQASQFDTSNDSYKIKLVNLSEEVQEAMAGTAPVVSSVEDGSLTASKYADDSISKKKVSFSYQNAGIVTGRIDIDTTAKTVSIGANTGYCTPDIYYAGLDRTTVDFSGFSNQSVTMFLYVDTTSNKLKVHNSRLEGNKWALVCTFLAGTYLPNDVAKISNVVGADRVYVNGISNGGWGYLDNIKKLQNDVSLLKSKYEKICSLSQAYTNWMSGEKFPIAIFGDSTTDGAGCTGWDNTNKNVIGVDWKFDKAYPYLLEQLIKEETGNDTVRVYNAGFNGYTLTQLDSKFTSILDTNEVYSDVKMIGISGGINDRLLSTTYKGYYDSVKSTLISIINKCYDRHIQPFLITCQMTPESYTNYDNYPLRDSVSIMMCSDQAKRDIAKEYNLEIIDINTLTQNFMWHSQNNGDTICDGMLHFKDVGHKFEAGALFSNICKRVIWINEADADRLVEFGDCRVKSNLLTIRAGTTYSGLSYINDDIDGFKIRGVCKNLSNEDDLLLMDFWIFNNTEGTIDLNCYWYNGNYGYVVVNGENVEITQSKQRVGSNLDIGLHHIKLYAKAGQDCEVKGFKIVKS